MKLLFDQNLSPRLVQRLADLHAGSCHVFDVGLGSAPDSAVWAHARDNDLTVVTRDADFVDLNLMLGFPPKVIWIRRGNCSTSDIESIFRSNAEAVGLFFADEVSGILTLF